MATFIVADAIANAQLDAIEAQIGASGLLQIWSGAVATIGADPGNLMASMVLPVDEWANAGVPTARQKTFNGPWVIPAANVVLGGAPGSFVLKTAGGVAMARGDVGGPGSGATMIVASVPLVVGVSLQINSFTLIRP